MPLRIWFFDEEIVEVLAGWAGAVNPATAAYGAVCLPLINGTAVSDQGDCRRRGDINFPPDIRRSASGNGIADKGVVDVETHSYARSIGSHRAVPAEG